MSAQPAEPVDPARSQPALSALEEALQQALSVAARDQVVSRIAMALPIEIDQSPASGLHGRAQDGRTQHGKVQKVSISMPAELIELVRARTGAGGFSRFVTDAVQEQVRLDLLADLSAELESDYGPVDADLVQEAMREWPDFATE